MLTGLVRFN